MSDLIRRTYFPEKSEMVTDVKWLGIAYKNYLYAIDCDDLREKKEAERCLK